MPRPGPRNLITDIPGLRVGNAEDETARSGVTVLLCESAMRAGVDVRGGGPGSREIDVLRPENLVGEVHGLVMSGGSVFGLAAADGVCALLSGRSVGLALGETAPRVPIVPAAVLYDLDNGGDKNWGDEPPYRALGIEAAEAAADSFALGAHGAGRGARAGLVAGGLGSASLDLGEGLTVGALVAANPVGSVLMPDGETYWAWPFEIDGEFGGGPPPGPVDASDPMPEQSRLKARGRLEPGSNTTVAIVASSGALTTAECRRVAIMAHDGIARAVRPAHTPFDGDTVFALAAGRSRLGEGFQRAAELARIGSAAADCLARAIARAVHSAPS